MARKVIGICLYIVAGFFVYLVSLLAFMDMSALPVPGPAWTKYAVIGGFSIPAAVAQLIGLAVSRFKQWKRDLGIVLVSGSGMTAFVVFTIACLLWSPETRALFPRNTWELFSDVATGVGGIVIIAGAGTALIVMSIRERDRER